MRPSEESAEKAIRSFIQESLGLTDERMPEVHLVEDGETGWAFWILPSDTTSYLHQDLKVEWYGTTFE